MSRYLPFNRPHLTGREFGNMQQAVENLHLSGDGPFTRQCQAWLEQRLGSVRALLTHSCTAALEMAALLIDVLPGDEVIMPSFTFVSTANAFVLRGAVPVFVDIRSDTLNVDERTIADALTPRTRAIVAVHYAGVPADMDAIAAVVKPETIPIIEDAAQALGSTYRGRPAGNLGNLAALSFHETKNVIAGEGGALLVNDRRFAERAEIIREKGTNRSKFLRGQVDKYTWVDLGSSFLPSELNAAFLHAQLQEADETTRRRREVWSWYYRRFEDLEKTGVLRRPIVPDACEHNAHMFYVLVPDLPARSRLLRYLNENGVNAVFHYVPLHSSVAGQRYGRAVGPMTHTDDLADRLIRLPLWVGMDQNDVDRVADLVGRGLQCLSSEAPPQTVEAPPR
jgi:dTDP-4-amino-4,6-dideoxygalactose transaminase